MTQSELNSVPLYSKVRAYWGSTQLDGYLIKKNTNAVIYIPSVYAIIHDYPASGITLIEAYQPDYIEYSQYDLDTLPMFSNVLVSYGVIRKTGIAIDKSFEYNQIYVFYLDGSAEWINIDYISFVSAPAKPIQPVIPPDEYTPGEPPGEIGPPPDNGTDDGDGQEDQTEPPAETQPLKIGAFAIGVGLILLFALIK